GIAPDSDAVCDAVVFRWIAALWKRWGYRPGMACSGLTGSPGARPSESYAARIEPVTFLSLLIQIRSSMRPSAPRTVEPASVFEPLVPTAVAQSTRPEIPRLTFVKSRIVPMLPV